MKLVQEEELGMIEGNADLTRWNRAGLDRFRYTSHGAAEFVEALRIAHLLLYERGKDPANLPAPDYWREGVETGEYLSGFTVDDLKSIFARPHMDSAPPSMATYREKLLAQYLTRLTDPSAQISRAFARAMHVLSETLDAYANEGTLRTATQTKHALSLLSLIGFRPTPAASAVVPIAYQMKADQTRGTLPEGTAFDYPLPEGGPNLTFEALEDIQAHPSLNALLPLGHDSRLDDIGENERKFILVETSVFSNELNDTVAVIDGGSTPEAVRIVGTDSQSRVVELHRTPGHATDGKLQTAELLTAPQAVWQTRPRGNWVHFKSKPATFPQAIVYTVNGARDGDYYRVDEVRGRDIRLTNLTKPLQLFGAVELATRAMGMMGNAGATDSDAGGSAAGFRLDHRDSRGRVIDELAGSEVVDPDQIVGVQATISGAEDQNGFDVVNPSGLLGLLGFGQPSLLLKPGESLGALEHTLSPASAYVEGTTATDFDKHSYLVFGLTNGDVVAAGFDAVRHDGGCTEIRASDVSFGHTEVVAIYADFPSASKFEADTKSPDPLAPSGSMIDILCPAGEQDMLRLGRQVLITKTDRTGAVEGKITEVGEAFSAHIKLSIDTGAASLAGYTLGGTVIYGNVADFGHGKRLPPRVLGSGDAGQEAQIMPIEEADISTRLNAGFPGGVAADIQVTVEGRIWQQVAPDASAGDGPHYSLIQQSDGKTVVKFHRLLASGTDNVTLSRIRTGAGAQGNAIPAHGVTNLQPKNSAVEAVVQPIAPQGGAHRQGVEALRDRGKSRYALFDRALGIRDFARLAESHTGVMHASAGLIRQGLGRGGNIIRLYVVPSGGSDLSMIEDQIETMLLAASLPGTVLDIQLYNSAPVTGTCDIRLKTGYADVHTIREELEAILTSRFGLAARPLGEAVYAAEFSAAIESHEAVDFVTITFDPICDGNDGVTCQRSVDGDVQAIRSDRRTSVYLKDFAEFTLNILPGTEGGS